ncbi:MAG: histidine phosphatase family protein [Bacteroidetes bacterium]|jgi:probable phosphoglycerate mutase|nr:histidine phosphatase family protein [Bacteroidota bacterium]
MNKKMIYLVRHGETEWNVERRYQGQLNSNLTNLGKEQAGQTGMLLKNTLIDLHISSDLPRAKQTADIIAETINKPVDRTHQEIRERHFGELQGLQRDEIGKQLPELEGDLFASNPDLKIPGGESFYEFYNRIVPFFDNLAQFEQANKILAVVHGGVLNCMFRHVLGISLSQTRNFSLKNASINTFSYDDKGWHLEAWGVTHII